MNRDAFLAKEDIYYERIGINKEVEVWEDGIRTTGDKGSYEWWYFDAEYSNGCKVVVIFYTKDRFDVRGRSHPTATIDITLPNGQTVSKWVSEKKNTKIKASREKCYVNIGESLIEYVDGDYKIHFIDEDIEYNCLMKSKVPMYRQDTGYIYFGEKEKDYFAWLVPQPYAEVEGSLKFNDTIYKSNGTGYHDHNWGNVDMRKVINNWYWCRASIGPYTIIANDIIAEKRYGYKRVPIFFIAKNGEVLKCNENKIRIFREDTEEHFLTRKSIDNKLTFIQENNENESYKIEFFRDHDIFASSLLNVIGLSKIEILLAKLKGLNPTYLRCVGFVKLTIKENDKEVVIEDEALWEQMFFGENKKILKM